MQNPCDLLTCCLVRRLQRVSNGNLLSLMIAYLPRAMNLAEFVDGKAQQPLPAAFKDRVAELDRFHKYCHSLMLKVLVLFGIGLEVYFPSST